MNSGAVHRFSSPRRQNRHEPSVRPSHGDADPLADGEPRRPGTGRLDRAHDLVARRDLRAGGAADRPRPGADRSGRPRSSDTRTRTSPGPGSGSGRSSRRSGPASIGPGRSTTQPAPVSARGPARQGAGGEDRVGRPGPCGPGGGRYAAGTPGAGGPCCARGMATAIRTAPTRASTPPVPRRPTEIQVRPGTVAPARASTSTPAEPSARMTTTVQLPSCGRQSRTWVPVPLASATQMSVSVGGMSGAPPLKPRIVPGPMCPLSHRGPRSPISWWPTSPR